MTFPEGFVQSVTYFSPRDCSKGDERGHFVIKMHMTIMPSCEGILSLAGFAEASRQDVSCFMERALWQGNRVGGWPTASKKRRLSA